MVLIEWSSLVTKKVTWKHASQTKQYNGYHNVKCQLFLYHLKNEFDLKPNLDGLNDMMNLSSAIVTN